MSKRKKSKAPTATEAAGLESSAIARSGRLRTAWSMLTPEERRIMEAAMRCRTVCIAAMEAALEHIGQTVPMTDNGRRERDEAMAQLRAAIKLAKGETNAQS